MLHGYRQNEMAFRERTGGMRKSLKSHAEFVFCEAPHVIPGEEENQRGWWFSDENNSYDALNYTACSTGFDKTVEHIQKVFESQGPFDGVFGFSQGACLTAILCALKQPSSPIKFRFAIIVAGFKSRQSQHEQYYDLSNKLDIPTLHVIGKGDKVIPSEMAADLANYFLNPKVFFHELGHFIPVNSESKNVFVEFLNEMKIKNSN